MKDNQLVMIGQMTNAPWVQTKHINENWIYAINGSEDGGDIICDQPKEELSGAKWEANSEAIASAVNNTWGADINPEAVPDLLESLKETLAQFKKIDKHYSKDHEIMARAEAA